MALLEVERLSVTFARYGGGLRHHDVQTIAELTLTVEAGQVVAVVGASGSGKSLLAHALLGLLPDNARLSGTIRFAGERLDAKRAAALRGKAIALIPQSVTYLNPLMRVGRQVLSSAPGPDPAAAQREIFARYRLDDQVERLYPFQLSGGMARRVLVATAAVGRPRLIVADEPTPGMQAEDVAETLRMFREFAEGGSGVLLITHDIEAAARASDRVAVLYAGMTVEIAAAADFAGDGARLRHPYSKALWRALPQNGFAPLAGADPGPASLPAGCPFAPRCGMATAECAAEKPELRELRGGAVRCIHAT